MRTRPSLHLLWSALFAVAVSSHADAQTKSTLIVPPRIGIIGGANLATFGGDNVTDVGNRTGFAGGGVLVWPLSPSFAFQPELLFTMKGAASTFGGVSSTAKVDYVEIPLLGRFDMPATAGIKPFIYGGPGLAVRTSCTFEGHSGATTVNTDCDKLTPTTDKFSTTDVGAIVGGGLAFDVGGRTLTIGARYELGMMKLVESGDAKNRVLSFVATFEWPFHP